MALGLVSLERVVVLSLGLGHFESAPSRAGLLIVLLGSGVDGEGADVAAVGGAGSDFREFNTCLVWLELDLNFVLVHSSL